MKKIQVGSSDFKDIRDGNFLFVDKSIFIKELIDDGSNVVLIPRPRRFGKTLNMSMVKYFFDNKEDNRDLFNGLDIENYEEIMKHQGKYPVIFISFKGVKAINIDGFYYKMKDTIPNLYMEHSFLLYRIL